MRDEQMPLFEVTTEPLGETEDVPVAPNHFISWDELQERWGYAPEQFAQADTTTMSPIKEDEDPNPAMTEKLSRFKPIGILLPNEDGSIVIKIPTE